MTARPGPELETVRPVAHAATDQRESHSGTGRRHPLVLVAAGAAVISFAPVFVKTATLDGTGPAVIGAWRCVLGGVLLLVLAASRGAPVLPPRRSAAAVVAAGVAFAVDLWAWHRSIALVGAGMATVLGNTQVFWTSAYGAAVHRESLPLRFVLAVLAAFSGVVLLAGIGSDVELSPRHVAGVGLGVATGLAYAIYLVTLKAATGDADRPAESIDAVTATMRTLGWVALVAGVLLALDAVHEGERLVPPTTRALLALVALAVVAQVLGWIWIASGLRGAPASRAALVLLLQPALATVWGRVFFGERLALLQIAGAALTLAAVYVGSGAGRRR